MLMAKVRPELKNRGIHSYQTMVFVVGRKPERGEEPSANSNTIDTNTWRYGGGTAPPTPGSAASPSSAVGSPPATSGRGDEEVIPAPPDQINAFTPNMPLKQGG